MKELNYQPPQNVELEKSILACVLNAPESYYSVINIINENSFYNDHNRAIFKAISKVIEAGKKLNIISAFEVITKMKLDFQVEPFELANIQNMVSIFGINELVEKCLIAKEYQIKRELLDFSLQLQQNIYSDNDVEELINYTNNTTTSILDNTIVNEQTKHIKPVLDECMKNMDSRLKAFASGKMNGITTGIKELDKITTGWKGNNLIILAARPAVGKTAFALKFVRSAAESGEPVAIFSLEMQNTSLADRILVGFSGVNANNFRSGRMDAGEISSVKQAKLEIEKLPIYIDDKPVVGVRYIKSVVRKLIKRNECKLAIIDYLQLIDAENSKGQNREQEVAKMSRGLKLLAKEMNIPVILLCQLSRKVEERGDKMPLLSDLRESGAIEQDADMVIFIHRPELYDKTNEDLKGKSVLLISKQRDGATGEVLCKNNVSLTKISDFDEVNDWAENEFKQIPNDFF